MKHCSVAQAGVSLRAKRSNFDDRAYRRGIQAADRLSHASGVPMVAVAFRTIAEMCGEYCSGFFPIAARLKAEHSSHQLLGRGEVVLARIL